MVTSPIGTTQIVRRNLHMQELLGRVRSELSRDELESLSNQAIDWIQKEAREEPGNRRKLSVLSESKKSILPSEVLRVDVFLKLFLCMTQESD